MRGSRRSFCEERCTASASEKHVEATAAGLGPRGRVTEEERPTEGTQTHSSSRLGSDLSGKVLSTLMNERTLLSWVAYLRAKLLIFRTNTEL